MQVEEFWSELLFMWLASSLYMTLMFCLSHPLKNAGLVDFAWPSSFTALTLYLMHSSTGWTTRTYVMGSLYLFCGVRFMVGWALRTAKHGEDKRWALWRDTWSNGDFLMTPTGIRNVRFNLFFFYHAQSTATALSMIVPLLLVSRAPSPSFSLLEVTGLCLWFVSFVFENIADMQLDQFKREKTNRGQVCRSGLWAYSRHPNYFGEFGLWLAYALMGWSSAQNGLEQTCMLACPLLAYGFLVYFTGVPITEISSAKRRGQAYVDYQQSTNMFFPGFSKKAKCA